MIKLSENRLIVKDTRPGLHSITLDQIDGAIAVIDGNLIIRLINNFGKVYQHLINVPIHEGSSLLEAVPVQYQGLAKKMLENVTNSTNPITVDVSCPSPNGTKLFFEVHCSPIHDSILGESLLFVEVRDVTPQKIFEKKLEAIASSMSSLVESANAVIIETDSREYITTWNRMSSVITGYQKGEVFARQLSEILVDEHERPSFTKALKQVLAGTTLGNYELRVRASNGRKLDFLLNANPKLNGSGQVIGISLVGQDITELVAYRNSLEAKVVERTRELNASNTETTAQKSIAERERKKSDQLLLNILPLAIANELKENGLVMPRQYKMATIIFADLVGFTVLGRELSAEGMLHELNYMFTGFDMILERYRLEKIKTMGDGYMAVGGVPEENTSNASDAVQAALAMIEFVSQVSQENARTGKPKWKLRVGINTGELVAGVIGKNKFAYDVWGPSVNLASRMESGGEPDRINISEYTYAHVKDEFICTYRGNFEVKNMGKMKMYFVDKK